MDAIQERGADVPKLDGALGWRLPPPVTQLQMQPGRAVTRQVDACHLGQCPDRRQDDAAVRRLFVRQHLATRARCGADESEQRDRSDRATSGHVAIRSDGGGAGASIGSITVNVVPTPTMLSTLMVPPRRSSSLRVMLSPSPVPPNSRVRHWSTG